jgi:hypothetical protein
MLANYTYVYYMNPLYEYIRKYIKNSNNNRTLNLVIDIALQKINTKLSLNSGIFLSSVRTKHRSMH